MASVVAGADRASLKSEVVARYEVGESVRDLAASYERSYGFIHRILAEAGVKMRSRGGARRRTRL